MFLFLMINIVVDDDYNHDEDGDCHVCIYTLLGS